MSNTQAQLPQGFINDNDNFINPTTDENGGIDCVVALSLSGKIVVMRGDDDMKSSLFRHQYAFVRSAKRTTQIVKRCKGYLEKAQQEFNVEFKERTMDALRLPEFSSAAFEDLKSLLVMYSALKSVPSQQFKIEPSTVALAAAVANVPALNAAAELYRTSVEDLISKVYRKHANKASAFDLTRKDKKNALTAVLHGMAEEVKTRASQALDDGHKMTGPMKKGLGLVVNEAKSDTKEERAKRANDVKQAKRKERPEYHKKKQAEYGNRHRDKTKQEEYDEYLGGVSWGEFYNRTVKKMAAQKINRVVYRN